MSSILDQLQSFLPINVSGGARKKLPQTFDEYVDGTPSISFSSKEDPAIAAQAAQEKADTELAATNAATAKIQQDAANAPIIAAQQAQQKAAQEQDAYFKRTTPWERDLAEQAKTLGIDLWTTSSPESREKYRIASDAYANYKYKGQEWNDPLAQQIYKQFDPSSTKPNRLFGSYFEHELYNANNKSPYDGTLWGTRGTSIDPKVWGSGQYTGGQGTKNMYDNMKAEYIKQGGLAYGPGNPYEQK